MSDVFRDSLWLGRKLQVCFWLRSYSGGFLWLKFTTERRILRVPWTSARNLLHISSWHLKVPSPGRGTYLPHIPRPYKHNVFKFWLCLFVWLGFFSKGNDRALHDDYLLLVLISHFSKQSLALPLEMNLLPVSREAGELWGGRGSLCAITANSAMLDKHWCVTAHGNAADMCGDLWFFRSITLCPRKGMCCPAQVFKYSRIIKS